MVWGEKQDGVSALKRSIPCLVPMVAIQCFLPLEKKEVFVSGRAIYLFFWARCWKNSCPFVLKWRWPFCSHFLVFPRGEKTWWLREGRAEGRIGETFLLVKEFLDTTQ